jgi:TatD DNase family protein
MVVPLNRLFIETDCPFLTPVPFRGRRNEPARVVEVARCLAGLHELETDEVGRLTAENFFRFFKLNQPQAQSLDAATGSPT